MQDGIGSKYLTGEDGEGICPSCFSERWSGHLIGCPYSLPSPLEPVRIVESSIVSGDESHSNE